MFLIDIIFTIIELAYSLVTGDRSESFVDWRRWFDLLWCSGEDKTIAFSISPQRAFEFWILEIWLKIDDDYTDLFLYYVDSKSPMLFFEPLLLFPIPLVEINSDFMILSMAFEESSS